MDTKLKNFKYSIIAKTVAFVIIIATVCIGIFGICTMAVTEKYIDFEPTIATNIYADDSYRRNVSEVASAIYYVGSYFKSEENIKAGNLLTDERILDAREEVYYKNWEDFCNSNSYTAENDGVDNKYNLYLSMINKSFDALGNIVITLDESMMTPAQIKFEKFYAKEFIQIHNDLISTDLWEYRSAMDTIYNATGVKYYVSHGGQIYANSEKPTLESLRENEVYYYSDASENESRIGKTGALGHSGYNYFHANKYVQLNDGDSVYITFTDEFSKQTVENFTQNRNTTISLIKTGGMLALLAFICFIYLLCTIGKREKGGQIHLIWFDRVFTEAIVAAAIFVLCVCGYYAAWCLRYSNLSFVLFLTGTASAICLFLLLSIVRRIKAHQLMQTTLCLRVLRAVIKWIVRGCNKMRDAFNGGSVCRRAVWAVVIFGFLCGITIFIFPITIILIATAAIVVGRCAKDYEAVAEGAQRIRAGELDFKIETGGKTIFTPLISDLNSITEGLNNAVANELKSERMKSELITNVSHDIRTPLTSIITYVDLINKEGLQSPNAPNYLEIIEQKSQRLKTLTDDLFEVSKAASGNVNVELENVDLTALIKQGMGELDDKIAQSGLDFKINMPDYAVLVRADGKLVWRVIENLLSNVFKYALSQSRVYIDVSQDLVSAHFVMKNISAVELNVSADELTERFKRGDSARQSEGSGLGLAIAKNLVELQNGVFELTVDGDLFKAEFTLPSVN